MKAQDLAQAIRFFDPRVPLSGSQLNYWFIERPDTPRHRIEVFMRAKMAPVKLLFIGPRGSGKTTELNKLATMVTDAFHVISIPALELTGHTSLDYVDLMLATSTQVIQEAINAKLMPRPLTKTLRHGLDDLNRWWDMVVAGLEIRRPAEEATVQVKLAWKMAEIQLGVKQSGHTRQRVHELLEPLLPELIHRLNWVLEQIKNHHRRPLLIVEGLDKIDLAAAESIFRDHAVTITAPTAAMIFTFPNALRFSDHFDTIQRNFDGCHVFPNFGIRTPHNSLIAQRVDELSELVLARLDARLIEPETLKFLVEVSGGQVSSLVTLVQNAAVEALTRGRSPVRINDEDGMTALKMMRRDLVGPLTRQDYQTLRNRHHDRRLTSDAIERRLLYNGTLLEYSNGQPWCDVHPALWELLERPDDADPDAE